MATAKPQISILMAVYEPRMDWLREQLDSLNAQTYPNIKLYVRDDCSPTVPYEEIERLVAECITAFPYEIKRNERNLGSNGTFELLTQEADGEYFAYCDQDDVWLEEKLTVLQEKLERTGSLLVCSDVTVIDGDGRTTANSITEVRRRHTFCCGDDVFAVLLTRNFVIGCTMLVCSEVAKCAVPFVDEMVHDHWIALVAASQGRICSILRPLIRYRIHGNNQTGVLTGVSNKQTYIIERIDKYLRRIVHIRERFPNHPEINAVFDWAHARYDFSQGTLRAAARMWKLRAINRPTTLFELVALKSPNFLFRYALKFARKPG